MALKGETIAQTDFPLYVVKALGSRHFFVAGGGGKAKTGVTNAFEIFDIGEENGKLICKKVKHHETGSQAIMNASVSMQDDRSSHYKLAAGMDGECALFELRSRVVTPKASDAEGNENVRKRKGNLTKSSEHQAAAKVVTFDIEEGERAQTDFDKDGGFQKAVAFTKDLSLMATGGADGHLRVWQHPSLKKLYEVKAHTNEIDDLDISIPGNRIVTVSRDGHAYTWNTKDGSKNGELHWNESLSDKYRARHCRFATVKDKKDTYVLFTTHIPLTRSGKAQPSYVTKWETKNYTPTKIQSTGTDIISAFAVHDDGIYLGVGSMTGTVSVFIAFSLQKLYEVKQCHDIFVTGLDFAPATGSANTGVGKFDFSMLSISVDNQIKLHQVSPRTMWHPFWAIAGFLLIIYFIYWLLTTNQL